VPAAPDRPGPMFRRFPHGVREGQVDLVVGETGRLPRESSLFRGRREVRQLARRLQRCFVNEECRSWDGGTRGIAGRDDTNGRDRREQQQRCGHRPVPESHIGAQNQLCRGSDDYMGEGCFSRDLRKALKSPPPTVNP